VRAFAFSNLLEFPPPTFR